MRQRRVQQGSSPPSSPILLKIIAANVVLYVLYLVGLRLGLPYLDRLLLVPKEVLTEGALWQLGAALTSFAVGAPRAAHDATLHASLRGLPGAHAESP